MAEWPVKGQKPYGAVLKAYIDGQVNPESVDAALPERLSEEGLSATIANEAPGAVKVDVRDAEGTATTGNVVVIGDYAYAPGGIATGAVFGGAVLNENVIGGNTANVNTTTSNLTGAPTLVSPDGNWNFILGGYDNVVNGWACAVIGYHCKVETGANHITISGGSIHSVATDASYGTIAGGTQNQIAGNNATVSGGSTNLATANQTTVGGGLQNQATAQSATVGGGTQNTATQNYATVAGGLSGDATGLSATVGGGQDNAATATGATVPGGRDNVAGGTYSIATGRSAVTTDPGQAAHANGAFAVAGDAQRNEFVLRNSTTTATATELLGQPVTPENTTIAFTGIVVARRTDVDGESAAWKIEGVMKRDAGNTCAFVGTPTVTQIAANVGNTWTFTLNTYSSGALRLICTGEAAKTIRWVCNLRSVQVQG